MAPASPPVLQAIDGRDGFAFHLGGEQQATVHRLAVDQDRAGSTVADVAAFLGAGQTQLLAQHVKQRLARLDRNGVAVAVDRQLP